MTQRQQQEGTRVGAFGGSVARTEGRMTGGNVEDNLLVESPSPQSRALLRLEVSFMLLRAFFPCVMGAGGVMAADGTRGRPAAGGALRAFAKKGWVRTSRRRAGFNDTDDRRSGGGKLGTQGMQRARGRDGSGGREPGGGYLIRCRL